MRDDLRPQGKLPPTPSVEEFAEPTILLVSLSITMLPCPDCLAGTASGERHALLAAAAAAAALLLLLLLLQRTTATVLFCCLLLLLTQLPSWSRSAGDMFRCWTSRVRYFFVFLRFLIPIVILFSSFWTSRSHSPPSG